MTLTREKYEFLCALGYRDLCSWETTFINQSADDLYGDDYGKLLSDAICNRDELINVYVRLASVVQRVDLGSRETEFLALLFAFSYDMLQYKEMAHLDFLTWVASEMGNFLLEAGIIVEEIRNYCTLKTSTGAWESTCLAASGLYEFESWQFSLSCLNDRISKKSFRDRLATMKTRHEGAFVSIQVRIQQFVDQKELHPRFQKTVARCCAESDHQPEYLEKDPIEFLLWVKAEMESLR